MTSGLSVGVPGTLATWEQALRRWGTLVAEQALSARDRGRRAGFAVDQTFRDQTAANAARFADFTSDARSSSCPAARRPRSARRSATPTSPTPTGCSAGKGVDWLYGGRARRGDRARPCRHPPVDARRRPARPPRPDGAGRPGGLPGAASAPPTQVTYRGPTSTAWRPRPRGGSTVGEALNILERSTWPAWAAPRPCTDYLEAQRARLRRPRPRTSATRRTSTCRSKQLLVRRVRRRAGLPDRPDARRCASRSPPGNPDGRYDRLRGTAAGAGRGDAARGPVDHPPDGRRPVGQRRRVHADHRADRRQRHRRAGPRASCSTTS